MLTLNSKNINILYVDTFISVPKRYTGNKVPQNVLKEVSKKCVGTKCPTPLPPNARNF